MFLPAVMFSSTVVFYFMRDFTSRWVANLVVLGCLSFGTANLIFYYTAEIAACPTSKCSHNCAHLSFGVLYSVQSLHLI